MTIQKIRKISVETVAGSFVLEMSSNGLYAVQFPGQYPVPRPGLTTLRPGLKRVSTVLQSYFKNPTRPLSIRFDLTGYTLFQRKVYAALRKVPAGNVITYGELARLAGYPGAARAVGNAMKKNRLPIIIPCHRVVPSAGGLGEYSAGKKWKRWLLMHEKRGLVARDSYATRPWTDPSFGGKKRGTKNESRGTSPEFLVP